MDGADKLIDWIKKTGLQNIVWTTDLDKTVLDVSANPEINAPSPGLEEAAIRLDKQTAGFYVITGREISFVDREVFPNTAVRISAEYHNMVRYAPNEPTRDLIVRPQWDLIQPDMDTLVADIPGAHLRIKPFMRSLHFSQVPADRQPAVKEKLRLALTGLLDRLHQSTGQKIDITDGGMTFDMGPAGRDKGMALNDIMIDAQDKNTGRKLIPIYFGDSPGDIPAGKAAQARGGVFVAVGNDPAVLALADFGLKDPAECRALFKKVSELTPAPVFTPPPLQL